MSKGTAIVKLRRTVTFSASTPVLIRCIRSEKPDNLPTEYTTASTTGQQLHPLLFMFICLPAMRFLSDIQGTTHDEDERSTQQ